MILIACAFLDSRGQSRLTKTGLPQAGFVSPEPGQNKKGPAANYSRTFDFGYP
ncbi:hypothetical protein SMB34_19110 [Thalassospira permensis NBRC 106175]|uniref:Uncharacterized protein n=1 Tax=Thalassospira permensis NBRC 106175 TaxID=1353532 RepID=A0ABR4TMS7_9PROT|nr:hypothetical protein SMB34_19110 [Thalassospira permensis NBRC 106175]